jgi:hypothetical protein
VIHFILLSTDRFNWLDAGRRSGTAAADMSPLPPGSR